MVGGCLHRGSRERGPAFTIRLTSCPQPETSGQPARAAACPSRLVFLERGSLFTVSFSLLSSPSTRLVRAKRAAPCRGGPVVLVRVSGGPPARCRHARRAGPGTAEATGPKELEYERATLTTISKDARLVTFINVFTVEPANQRRLVDLLARVTDTSVRHAPGFVSSVLHRSLDGTKVTMYAQWRTIEDYEAMRKDPAPLPYLQEAMTIAKFEPGMYEVVETYLPSDSTT
jgi:quinol monooxygenase YgiN